jgi:hypothetical protein
MTSNPPLSQRKLKKLYLAVILWLRLRKIRKFLKILEKPYSDQQPPSFTLETFFSGHIGPQLNIFGIYEQLVF